MFRPRQWSAAQMCTSQVCYCSPTPTPLQTCMHSPFWEQLHVFSWEAIIKLCYAVSGGVSGCNVVART